MLRFKSIKTKKKDATLAKLFANTDKNKTTVEEQMRRFALGMKALNSPQMLSPPEIVEVTERVVSLREKGVGDRYFLSEYLTLLKVVMSAYELKNKGIKVEWSNLNK